MKKTQNVIQNGMAIISNHTCQSLQRLKEKHINYTRHKNSQKMYITNNEQIIKLYQ